MLTTTTTGKKFLALRPEEQQELITVLGSIGHEYRERVLSAVTAAVSAAHIRLEPMISKYGEGILYDATFDERLRESVATPVTEDDRFNAHLADVLASWMLTSVMNGLFEEPKS